MIGRTGAVAGLLGVMLFGGLYGAFAVTRPVQIPPWVVLLVALCVFWGAAFGSEWVLEKLAARAGSQDI